MAQNRYQLRKVHLVRLGYCGGLCDLHPSIDKQAGVLLECKASNLVNRFSHQAPLMRRMYILHPYLLKYIRKLFDADLN